MTDEPTLEAALDRLTRAIDQLEGATSRQRDGERARADLDAELAAVQDDRQRLAFELDAVTARASRLDAAAGEIDRRLEGAMAELRAVAAAVAEEA